MLNYNKIHSLINSQEVKIFRLADKMGIPESTLRHRLKKENLSPNDVEKIAKFFSRSIIYFFDLEDPEHNDHSDNCSECEEKQKEIDKLKACIEKLWIEKDEVYRKYTECLEELLDKKGNSVKNSA